MIEITSTESQTKFRSRAASNASDAHSRGSLLKQEIEHEFEEPIFISNRSKCCWCGPSNHHCRLETFEILESHRFQMIMLILLCIDVLIVVLEIGVQVRLIEPAPGLDITSLAIPAESVCAVPNEVKHKFGFPEKEGIKYFRTYNEDGTLEDCCTLLHTKYSVIDIWNNGHVGPVAENVDACMILTKGSFYNRSVAYQYNSANVSATNGNSHRRMLLSSASSSSTSASTSSTTSSTSSSTSSSSHAPPGPRCYKYPGHRKFNLFLDPITTAIKHVLTFHSLIQSSSISSSSLSSSYSAEYAPPPGHTTIESTLHWSSNSILFVFLIELILIMYSMGCKQFFCSCNVAVYEDDIVEVIDPDNFGEVKCAHGMVTTLNHHTGRACIRPIGMDDFDAKASKIKKNVMTRLMSSQNKKGVFQIASIKQKPIGRKMSMRFMKQAEEMINPLDQEHKDAEQDANDLVLSHQVLTKIPFWSISLYSVSKAREEGNISMQHYCDCNRTGKCRCCCQWFNKYFVLDFIIVILAILMENLTQIFEALDIPLDSSTVTEAGAFIVFVRLWR